eukprot:CAMPEP_0113894534 /NCGR_PEP_ID=MMETSP0780_2-20120614/16787_1 /TAXON_ID=652834 /ORGANISM="Palpitomonas bilix" /LENGTH=190 /DNA_ID=CAMNT_0000885117 /DNA_START=1187 /DNA_END=1756 /DNA_ORIENTATION=+ /assembly_acc=CAM_ASM_000599
MIVLGIVGGVLALRYRSKFVIWGTATAGGFMFMMGVVGILHFALGCITLSGLVGEGAMQRIECEWTSYPAPWSLQQLLDTSSGMSVLYPGIAVIIVYYVITVLVIVGGIAFQWKKWKSYDDPYLASIYASNVQPVDEVGYDDVEEDRRRRKKQNHLRRREQDLAASDSRGKEGNGKRRGSLVNQPSKAGW